MKVPTSPWHRLIAMARRVDDERDPSAPYGFATRVAALAFSAERPLYSLLERFSLRALVLAGVLTVITVATNLAPILNAVDDEAVTETATAVIADLPDIS
jgi:hypothetical protein